MMANVHFICDGGTHYGFGHLRRSVTLSETLRRRGVGAKVQAVSEQGRLYLPRSESDAGEADVVVVDLPYDGDAVVKQARDQGKAVVALDFIGRCAPNTMISIFDRGTAPVGARHLIGFEYAIIRDDIRNLAPAPTGEGVIVMIGGGDREGIGVQAAVALRSKGCAVTLIEGPLAKPSERSICGIERLSQPPDLAIRMANCAWGVTGAGGAMMEMMCLGKAVHVIARNSFEENLARLACSRGAAIGVGMESLAPPSLGQLEKVSNRAAQTVDGKGVERIADEIQALL
jgi:spore coat polysaccharide biosynthesis predicted glycosyltransferase SpsG